MARTREFDEAEALDAAMKVFWAAGYDGTSMDMLTTALGIGKPSLYAAFGNKRSLYSKAVSRYCELTRDFREAALAMPDFREAVRAYWELYATGSQGCFLVQTGLTCSDTDVGEETAEKRRAAEVLLTKRAMKAKRDGQLDDESKPADVARYVSSVAYGLSVQSKNGATVAERQRVADLALEALPRKR
ncbi:MAG: TetR/AcrR family transcriptional regulator [Archangium sp.]